MVILLKEIANGKKFSFDKFLIVSRLADTFGMSDKDKIILELKGQTQQLVLRRDG